MKKELDFSTLTQRDLDKAWKLFEDVHAVVMKSDYDGLIVLAMALFFLASVCSASGVEPGDVDPLLDFMRPRLKDYIIDCALAQ